MFLPSLAILLATTSYVLAAPKILICSDSTTADYNSTSPLQGWGFYLHEYMSIKVINKARNGRSTRSFIREGLWSELLKLSSPGDFIVIEMGHNDSGDPSSKNTNHDKASRATIRGTGNQTLVGPLKSGGTETVHTFGWYLRQMIADAQKKQTIPLISGMVPTNSFQGTTFRTNWPMAEDAKTVAKQQGVEYLDHTGYTAKRYQGMGPAGVKALFPKDSTHTNAAGAKLNAETFITAVRCAKSKATSYVNSKGQALPQRC